MEDYKKALRERQEKWLKENCGIETYDQLLEAMRTEEPLDFWFLAPLPNMNKTTA